MTRDKTFTADKVTYRPDGHYYVLGVWVTALTMKEAARVAKEADLIVKGWELAQYNSDAQSLSIAHPGEVVWIDTDDPTRTPQVGGARELAEQAARAYAQRHR